MHDVPAQCGHRLGAVGRNRPTSGGGTETAGASSRGRPEAVAATTTPAAAEAIAAVEIPAGRPAGSPPVVYMAKPLEREAALAGYTYKLKWPGSDHALYITINDIERDGRRRPFEIFINTKNLDHYAWTVALTRMISAVFRRGGDVTFVVEELKAVFDPGGGHWVQGRYVPSLIAAIGETIETHMRRTGFLKSDDQPAGREHRIQAMPAGEISDRTYRAAQSSSGDHDGQHGHDRMGALIGTEPEGGDAGPARGSDWRSGMAQCPRCGAATYTKVEGCWVCRTCGYSRCG